MRLSPRFKARAYDLVPAIPLLLLYGLAIAATLLQIAAKADGGVAPMPTALGLEILAQVATVIFLGVQITVFIIRRLPQARLGGVAPTLAAVAGAISPLLLVALPKAPTSMASSTLSMVLIIAGTAGATWVLAILGRSFAILPQARGLVTKGPYRLIRHPLYLAQQISTFGVMFQFMQPWSFLVAVASFAPQIVRMRYEEAILAKTYPAYRDYMRTTSRLIPGIY
jgi:protein-S-isoprenylcysteine O-methyltransferase Ste14